MTLIKSFAIATFIGLTATTACKNKDAAPAPTPTPVKTEPAAVKPDPAPTPTPPPPAPAPAANTIVDVAVAAGSFTTLAKALEVAGLVDTLKGPGPFTVFAPTDEAFAKVPKADLDALLADKAKLTAVLTYHVVAGKVLAADVATMKTAKSLQGQDLVIDTKDGVKIGNAKVIKADIMADNGVIHVIDAVLMPAAK
jgi:uncharacterized surface protein with fasciclin (FAS1) repeats